MGACGITSWSGDVCERPAGHDGYHERREEHETVRWSSHSCDDPCPQVEGWLCSLQAGHAGMHEAWVHHRLISGAEPSHRWGHAATASEDWIDEYDLLPDATPEDERTLAANGPSTKEGG